MKSEWWCWCKSKTYPNECNAPLFAVHFQGANVSGIMATNVVYANAPTTHSCRTTHEMRWWENPISAHLSTMHQSAIVKTVVNIVSRMHDILQQIANNKFRYGVRSPLPCVRSKCVNWVSPPFSPSRLPHSRSDSRLPLSIIPCSHSGHRPLFACSRSTCVRAAVKTNDQWSVKQHENSKVRHTHTAHTINYFIDENVFPII